MKETYELAVQLPFDDYAGIDWEMTEEEYEEFLEYCNDYSIWDEEKYQDLLSAAATAAADYIVRNYCEADDADKYESEGYCTPARLMDYLDKTDDYWEDFINSDGQRKRELLTELLWENRAFYINED